jgi:hypothetical protein
MKRARTRSQKNAPPPHPSAEQRLVAIIALETFEEAARTESHVETTKASSHCPRSLLETILLRSFRYRGTFVPTKTAPAVAAGPRWRGDPNVNNRLSLFEEFRKRGSIIEGVIDKGARGKLVCLAGFE